VLVSSTDGVGTKLKVAMLMKKHNTVGQDLVHHCINDISVCGARPLFFLDYFGCGQLDEQIYSDIITGLTDACHAANLPLIGGETAEMPDLYLFGDYDLVGTIVGVVEKEKIIDGKDIKAGDVIVGIASNGLHTNGYTLARKILLSRLKVDDYIEEIDSVLGEELLKIHENYYPVIKELTTKFPVKGMAHITGGGIYKNTIRVIPDGLTVEIKWKSWAVPSIFNFIQELGDVPETDMRQTFNLGIGLIMVMESKYLSDLLSYVKKYKRCFYTIGDVIPKTL
jgi:phosphoribosylformylglycinamidine cyclo-ligase